MHRVHVELSLNQECSPNRNDKYEAYSHDWIHGNLRDCLIPYDRNRHVYVGNLCLVECELQQCNEFEPVS